VLSFAAKKSRQRGHNLAWHAGAQRCIPLAAHVAQGEAIQSNKVYLPLEALVVSTDLASGHIETIR
jgi:hypothetical protein